MAISIVVREDFPMEIGDRMFVKLPGGERMRIKVRQEGEPHNKQRFFQGVVEVVKRPARVHATSRAFPEFRRGR